MFFLFYRIKKENVSQRKYVFIFSNSLGIGGNHCACTCTLQCDCQQVVCSAHFEIISLKVSAHVGTRRRDMSQQHVAATKSCVVHTAGT